MATPRRPPRSSQLAPEAEEWDLTMEEMDSIERSAAAELAARRLESPLKSHPELLAREMEGRASQHRPSASQSPPVSPFSKRPVKIRVLRDGPARIAVEAPYNAVLISAYKSVPGHEWDPSRKLWLFPEHNLQELMAAVTRSPDLLLDIQPVPPLQLPSSNIAWNSASSSGHGLSPCSTPIKSQPSQNSKVEIGSPLKELAVRIFLIGDNRIASKSPFDQNVKQACQSVAGSIWNNEERMWTYPKSGLADLMNALRNILSPRLKIELVPPLVLSSDQIPEPASPCHPIRGESEPFSVAVDKPPPSSPNSPKQFVKFFLHSTGLIAIKFEPLQKLVALVKSIPRAFWNYKERLWMLPARSLPEAAKAFEEVRCDVEVCEPLIRRALEFKRNVPDLSDLYKNILPALESNLMPFQKEGVRFVLQHGGRVLIADEMGLGKTVQAIAAVSCLREDWPVLVVVPSCLRIHWATMLRTWLGLHSSAITVVLSQGTGSNQGYTITHSNAKSPLELNGLFNIISYDMLMKLPADNNFKIVIADESHYIKNAQAKRTNACVPIIQKAKYAMLLTGTPALSRPIELFKQLEALQPSVYCDVHEYGQRYCLGSQFGLYQGATNREELHALLKNTVMIRRLKKDVLSELPEKSREQVFLSLDTKNTKELRALIKELKVIREKIQNSAQSNTEKWNREEKILVTKIYAESAVAKIPAVQDYLSTMLETNYKFLVFAHHHTMMNGISEFLSKKKVEFIRIDGETSPVIRQSMVDSFQNNDKVKVAVLSIRAAGVGLTLTAASTIIFAEMSWTPGDLIQAEDRAHRIGQRSSVNIYYLHAPDTIDDFIWDSVHRKLGNLGQVLNGREETMRVSSPLQQRQKTLNSYLRPCSRNLSEQYDKEIEAGPSSPADSSNNSPASKRPRIL